MISKGCATKYCCEDISLIENYEIAINDNTQIWDCHHILETDLNLTRQDLIDIGRYLNVPAAELIYLPHGVHIALHNSSRIISEETRQKHSISFKGFKHSEESKRKMSESRKGIVSPNKGKPAWNKGLHTGIITKGFTGQKHSEETKRKMSESHKKKKAA